VVLLRYYHGNERNIKRRMALATKEKKRERERGKHEI